mmetsp:Transcript_17773/g.61398  ORF Transcript_17773/g.61398 Transcript_17773/m.61398 type:complete len:246 (-) Transcript_17773:2-739(-)
MPPPKCRWVLHGRRWRRCCTRHRRRRRWRRRSPPRRHRSPRLHPSSRLRRSPRLRQSSRHRSPRLRQSSRRRWSFGRRRSSRRRRRPRCRRPPRRRCRQRRRSPRIRCRSPPRWRRQRRQSPQRLSRRQSLWRPRRRSPRPNDKSHCKWGHRASTLRRESTRLRIAPTHTTTITATILMGRRLRLKAVGTATILMNCLRPSTRAFRPPTARAAPRPLPRRPLWKSGFLLKELLRLPQPRRQPQPR